MRDKIKLFGKKKIAILCAVIAAALLVTGVSVGLYTYYTKNADLVYSEVYMEAGDEVPELSEFLKRPEPAARFITEPDIDSAVPGEYTLDIAYDMPIFGEQQYTTTLHIEDTMAPAITVKDEAITLYVGDPVPTAEELLSEVFDVTPCTVRYESDYDFGQEGDVALNIIVTDTSGNSSQATVECTVIEDTEPPVITAEDTIVFTMGEPFSYKKAITVTDNCDDDPEIIVDDSEVNPNKRGYYKATYTVRDKAGNEATETVTVRVVNAKIAEATEASVNAMADAILADITTPDMDQLEVARAIYDWAVYQIKYSEYEGVDDLLSAAYKGMKYHLGDCTVKQKTAEYLLTRAGIKNMEIEKIRDWRGHYWLLIDVGEGWYHYDPNLQLDGTLIFYWHDEDLWAYSNAHRNTHNYDKSKYPTIQ